jgi:hypothetical protein
VEKGKGNDLDENPGRKRLDKGKGREVVHGTGDVKLDKGKGREVVRDNGQEDTDFDWTLGKGSTQAERDQMAEEVAELLREAALSSAEDAQAIDKVATPAKKPKEEPGPIGSVRSIRLIIKAKKSASALTPSRPSHPPAVKKGAPSTIPKPTPRILDFDNTPAQSVIVQTPFTGQSTNNGTGTGVGTETETPTRRSQRVQGMNAKRKSEEELNKENKKVKEEGLRVGSRRGVEGKRECGVG